MNFKKKRAQSHWTTPYCTHALPYHHFHLFLLLSSNALLMNFKALTSCLFPTVTFYFRTLRLRSWIWRILKYALFQWHYSTEQHCDRNLAAVDLFRQRSYARGMQNTLHYRCCSTFVASPLTWTPSVLPQFLPTFSVLSTTKMSIIDCLTFLTNACFRDSQTFELGVPSIALSIKATAPRAVTNFASLDTFHTCS